MRFRVEEHYTPHKAVPLMTTGGRHPLGAMSHWSCNGKKTKSTPLLNLCAGGFSSQMGSLSTFTLSNSTVLSGTGGIGGVKFPYHKFFLIFKNLMGDVRAVWWPYVYIGFTRLYFPQMVPFLENHCSSLFPNMNLEKKRFLWIWFSSQLKHQSYHKIL